MSETVSKKLVWDTEGERYYETGVSKGVLYVMNDSGAYPKGEAWNGLTAVNESPSGAEATALYANNDKYLELISRETFGATIEAYTYPDGFAECNGEKTLANGVFVTQQTRKKFGFSYTVKKGNDLDGDEYGEIIHVVYGCYAQPSEKSHSTVNDSPEAVTMSWTITTTPAEVPGMGKTSHIMIDTKKISAAALTAVKNALYGTDTVDAYLPSPTALKTLIDSAS